MQDQPLGYLAQEAVCDAYIDLCSAALEIPAPTKSLTSTPTQETIARARRAAGSAAALAEHAARAQDLAKPFRKALVDAGTYFMQDTSHAYSQLHRHALPSTTAEHEAARAIHEVAVAALTLLQRIASAS